MLSVKKLSKYSVRFHTLKPNVSSSTDLKNSKIVNCGKIDTMLVHQEGEQLDLERVGLRWSDVDVHCWSGCPPGGWQLVKEPNQQELA